MIIININSEANSSLKQLFSLANREDSVLVSDSTGEFYSISRVKTIRQQDTGNPADEFVSKLQKTAEEDFEIIVPEYQQQLTSEEFAEGLRDPGKENNYSIDKFIEETQQLVDEYEENQRRNPQDDQPKEISEEMRKFLDGLDDGGISDEEFAEVERQYEEETRRQREEAIRKTKKRGRPRKIKTPGESGSEPIPF